jgi:hypothetical protein
VRREQNLGNNIHITLAERAPVWKKQVTDGESDITDRVATVLEAAREAQAKRQEVCILE